MSVLEFRLFLTLVTCCWHADHVSLRVFLELTFSCTVTWIYGTSNILFNCRAICNITLHITIKYYTDFRENAFSVTIPCSLIFRTTRISVILLSHKQKRLVNGNLFENSIELIELKASARWLLKSRQGRRFHQTPGNNKTPLHATVSDFHRWTSGINYLSV